VYDPKDDYVVWGFITIERPNIIHYIFTKNHFRSHGVGKALFEKAIEILKTKNLIMSHLPKYKKYPDGYKFEYNPYTFLSKEIIDENTISKSCTSGEIRRKDVDESECRRPVGPEGLGAQLE